MRSNFEKKKKIVNFWLKRYPDKINVLFVTIFEFQIII